MRRVVRVLVFVLSTSCNCGSVPPVISDGGVGGGEAGGTVAGGAAAGGAAGGSTAGGGVTAGGAAALMRQSLELSAVVGRVQAGSVTLDVRVGATASPRRATAGTVSFELVSP